MVGLEEVGFHCKANLLLEYLSWELGSLHWILFYPSNIYLSHSAFSQRSIVGMSSLVLDSG